jgi:nickel-dependent lactate racemase
MLGPEVLASVEVVNHDAEDSASLVWMGTHGDGVPVWLNRRWVESDVRITTGYVEPHFFAGFSGGPKLAAPGLAGLETTLTLHDAARIGHPDARWGVTEGNPVHDDVRAIAAATGTHFALDVVLDGDKRIAQAFGGELFAMHERACALVRATAMRAVPRPFDVVLTTNSGFPLDQNLYQAVKGMSAAAQVVRPGGAIVCAAECRDGFPEHGPYRAELTAAASPAALLEAIAAREETVADQWQIQIQAGIQARSRVIVHTSYLSDAELAAAHLEQTPDIEATVRGLLAERGPDARVCVLPYGPLTVPYLAA